MERENHGNGNKVLLTVIGAATLLTALVGATFAYFSATASSEEQTVTTATSNISVSIPEDNTIENLRPTTFDTDSPVEKAGEVVKIPVTVQGKSTASGSYTLSLNEPEITLSAGTTHDGALAQNDQSDVSDIKWAVYDSDGKLVKTDSFTGTTQTTEIKTNSYAAGDGATNNIDDSYYVYVWIDNKNYDQNKLQDLTFEVGFAVTVRSN